MEEFKAGEIVELKSGGPKMTIRSIGTYGGNRKAACVWFDSESKFRENVFEFEVLKRVDEKAAAATA